jgi:hypothetical protein
MRNARRARQYQLLNVALKSQVVEVAAVQAGERGYRENFQRAFFLGGGLHDRIVAVNRRQIHAFLAQSPDRPAHGRRDIEKF